MSKKLKVFEAFAGIGAQTMALKNIGVKHEVVAISEIDEYAIASYEGIHGEVNNIGDISRIDVSDIPEHDLFTYSFPCQDLSLAGEQKGLSKGTRSSLLYECEKVIEAKKPKYLLLENVKNLVGKRFKGDFDRWLEWLEEQGYNNYWDVLNAKDFGLAQNRERVFVVSIRKDIDVDGYEFPQNNNSNVELEDILSHDAEDKYYLKDDWVRTLVGREKDGKLGSLPDFKSRILCSSALSSREHRGSGWREISGTMCARDYKDPKVLAVSICDTKQLKDEYIFGEDYRIRKLTPLECWLLQGFTERQYFMAKEELEARFYNGKDRSNTQMYKQAGNSIAVPVLEGIFRNIFVK